MASLDTAFCNSVHRQGLLKLFAFEHFTHDSLKLKGTTNGSYFLWLVLRNLRIQDLFLQNSTNLELVLPTLQTILIRTKVVRNLKLKYDHNTSALVSLAENKIHGLDLTNNQLIEIISKQSNLQELRLDHCNHIISSVIYDIAKHCPNLTVCSTIQCHLISASYEVVKAKIFPCLTSLQFMTGTTSTQMIDALTYANNITAISMSNVSKSEFTHEVTSAFENNLTHTLTCFTRSIPAGSENISELLPTLAKCCKLTTLDISNSGVTDENLLMMASNCKRIKTLNLANNPLITDVGICAIAQNLRCLVNLKIRVCSLITDTGVLAIAKHSFLLERVEIVNCPQVTNDAVIELYRNCPRLTHLDTGDSSGATALQLLSLIAHSCTAFYFSKHPNNLLNLTLST